MRHFWVSAAPQINPPMLMTISVVLKLVARARGGRRAARPGRLRLAARRPPRVPPHHCGNCYKPSNGKEGKSPGSPPGGAIRSTSKIAGTLKSYLDAGYLAIGN